MLKISPETPGRGEELHLDAARQGLAPTVGSQGKPTAHPCDKKPCEV